MSIARVIDLFFALTKLAASQHSDEHSDEGSFSSCFGYTVSFMSILFVQLSGKAALENKNVPLNSEGSMPHERGSAMKTSSYIVHYISLTADLTCCGG